jgi:drug/metabolite transporter (DMT)-like permease
MAVVLALLSAVSYGLSDFVGGLVSRRATVWGVAVLAQVSSSACTVLLAAFRPGAPTAADFAWAAVGGVATGVGTGFLYRGLAGGRMGVVAPVSAVGAAVVPVVVGLVVGERPGPLVWVGILAALPGIWLVSSTPDDPLHHTEADQPAGGRPDSGLLDGILAGLGFGVLFAAIAQVPEEAGMWPLAVAQTVSIPSVMLLAVALGAAWLPREPHAAWGLLCGPLASAATVLFLLATQSGLLTISAVLTSLYPAVTVILAATLLREPIHRVQAAGLAVCAAAVTLVAAG